MTETSMSPRISATSPSSSTPLQILVAEDDESLRKLLTLTLKLDGYQVVTATNGQEALLVFDDHDIDVVLLDVSMPVVDGYEVCAQLRKRTDVPIIMVTAHSRTDEIVTGIELGADHYLTKPFVLQELRARIRATLRRVQHRLRRRSLNILSYGEITLNEEVQQVLVRDEIVNLTPSEYRLLSYLMHNPDKPISKDELLTFVWEYHPHEDVSFVRVTMRRLRSKIEKDPAEPQYLLTVHGLGYQFCTNPTVKSKESQKNTAKPATVTSHPSSGAVFAYT